MDDSTESVEDADTIKDLREKLVLENIEKQKSYDTIQYLQSQIEQLARQNDEDCDKLAQENLMLSQRNKLLNEEMLSNEFDILQIDDAMSSYRADQRPTPR